MSRPLRIEFPGAVYHVTSRGNAGRQVFSDADDGARFMGLLEREIAQQRWLCHGFCLMPDHYHLLLETPEPNLGRGMARLNMSSSQWFNRRHHAPGHLFQGRYRAILVEKGDALMALVRHVVLNPQRRGLVNHAALWRWRQLPRPRRWRRTRLGARRLDTGPAGRRARKLPPLRR